MFEGFSALFKILGRGSLMILHATMKESQEVSLETREDFSVILRKPSQDSSMID